MATKGRNGEKRNAGQECPANSQAGMPALRRRGGLALERLLADGNLREGEGFGPAAHHRIRIFHKGISRYTMGNIFFLRAGCAAAMRGGLNRKWFMDRFLSIGMSKVRGQDRRALVNERPQWPEWSGAEIRMPNES